MGINTDKDANIITICHPSQTPSHLPWSIDFHTLLQTLFMISKAYSTIKLRAARFFSIIITRINPMLLLMHDMCGDDNGLDYSRLLYPLDLRIYTYRTLNDMEG